MLRHILLIVTHQPARSMTYSNRLFLKVVSNHGVLRKVRLKSTLPTSNAILVLDWGWTKSGVMGLQRMLRF